MLSIEDLEDKLMNDFRAYDVNKLSIQEFKSETNGYDRAGRIQKIIGDVVNSMNLISDSAHQSQSLDPPFLYFNGEVYQYVEYRLFRKCVREFLYGIGMKPQDWLRFNGHIMSAAKEPVILKKFIKEPRYVAFKNCIVDFENLTTHSFSPQVHIDHQLDYDFDLTQDCPKWKLFLNQVLPNKTAQNIIQQFFGLAFLDRYKNEHKVEKALILVGEGSNGKSVIFETIMNIFGTSNISNMDLNSLSKGGDEGQRNMLMLDGKRFNYCSEEQIGKVIQRSDIFKTLVSGEPVYARRIGGNSFRVHNIPFLVFNMNKLPKFNDDTHGLYRRLLIVSFNVIIPDELQDRQLAFKLKKERPGILKWLYEGYRTLKANKFQFITDSELEKVNVRFMESQDPIRAWLNSMQLRAKPIYGAEGDEPQEMLSADMYDSYLAYCEAKNIASESIQKWGRSMSDKGFKKNRRSNGMVYTFYGDREKVVHDTEIIAHTEGVAKID